MNSNPPVASKQIAVTRYHVHHMQVSIALVAVADAAQISASSPFSIIASTQLPVCAVSHYTGGIDLLRASCAVIRSGRPLTWRSCQGWGFYRQACVVCSRLRI